MDNTKYPVYTKGTTKHKIYKDSESDAIKNNLPTYKAHGIEYKNKNYRNIQSNANELISRKDLISPKPEIDNSKILPIKSNTKNNIKSINKIQNLKPTIYKNVEIVGKKGVLSDVTNMFKYGLPKSKTPDGNNVYLKRKPIKMS